MYYSMEVGKNKFSEIWKSVDIRFAIIEGSISYVVFNGGRMVCSGIVEILMLGSISLLTKESWVDGEPLGGTVPIGITSCIFLDM
ncbi:hypothetical protein PIROE2DRAFT_7868 [Piromyces sp. E2]|nr:hypothetical protein PIROE2DRAFT_7868 [Piromyces sp. E2]|eukprot:OUM65151.1 hypothetical protein PIROE2DRAFT_7868 [Piromyces sp. E2]